MPSLTRSIGALAMLTALALLGAACGSGATDLDTAASTGTAQSATTGEAGEGADDVSGDSADSADGSSGEAAGTGSDSGSAGGVGGAIYADGPGSVSIVDSTGTVIGSIGSDSGARSLGSMPRPWRTGCSKGSTTSSSPWTATT